MQSAADRLIGMLSYIFMDTLYLNCVSHELFKKIFAHWRKKRSYCMRVRVAAQSSVSRAHLQPASGLH